MLLFAAARTPICVDQPKHQTNPYGLYKPAVKRKLAEIHLIFGVLMAVQNNTGVTEKLIVLKLPMAMLKSFAGTTGTCIIASNVAAEHRRRIGAR